MDTNITRIIHNEEGDAKLQGENETRLWTVREVADHFNVSEETIRRLYKSGGLPHIRIGRCIRVPKQAVLDWVQGQTLYNLECAGSDVQEKSTCHISANKVRTGGHRSPMQTAKELDALLEPPSARKRKP